MSRDAIEERNALRARLASAEAQRDAQAAYNARLVEKGTALYAQLGFWHGAESYPPTQAAMAEWDHLLEEAPATSLERLLEERHGELLERAKGAEAREAQAIDVAYGVRRLWQAAAACLSHHQHKIKPRGPDERRMLEAAAAIDHGPFWAGTTDGWIAEKD